MVKADKDQKIKELLKIANAQGGYLTYSRINEVLPDSVISAEEIDSIIILLRQMDVDVVDDKDVVRRKAEIASAAKAEKRERSAKLEFIDDPVRMYLKQMGQVPLLTREQEVEISKRIEKSETQIRETIFSLGYTPRLALDLAERVCAGRERFDRVIQDKRVKNRDTYIAEEKEIRPKLDKIDREMTRRYLQIRRAKPGTKTRLRLEREYAKLHETMVGLVRRLHFKQNAIEEFVDKLDPKARRISELEREAERLRKSRAKNAGRRLAQVRRELLAMEQEARVSLDEVKRQPAS